MTVSIIQGDVIDRLREIPDDFFDCCVTSPPYWGLRDYGVEGQFGLEPTLAEHIENMVRVCEEIRRVLKPSGTFWLNYGDCYATQPNGRSAAETNAGDTDDRMFTDKPFSTVQGALKPKDLVMLPNRLAIALQDAGWWIRSEIIWGKNNPMPDSSGAYRPSTSHEKIFMLAKNADAGGWWVCRQTGEVTATPDLSETVTISTQNGPKDVNRWRSLGHYYNAREVKQGRSTDVDGKMPDGWDTGDGAHGTFHRNGRESGKKADKQRGHSRRHAGFNDRWDAMTKEEQSANGRYLRNYEPAFQPVWEIATKPFKGSHFATFPPELVQRCLSAGCPRGGHVIDPFGGAGTTGLVADSMMMDATLIELNPEYVKIAEDRLAAGLVTLKRSPIARSGLGGLFDDVDQSQSTADRKR